MSSLGHVLTLIGLDLALLAGWIAILLGLSGNFILLGLALIVAWTGRFQTIGWGALLVMASAVILAEIIEASFGSLMARKFGAGKWGMLGALFGGFAGAALGTVILPILGSIIGSFVGAALGATITEMIRQRKGASGLRAGWGAFLGKLVATAIKLAIGTAIVVYIIIRTH